MPENENEVKPQKKKRGVLKVIIVLLVLVLAAVIGGYALSIYYPGLLPSAVVEPAATPEESLDVIEPEETKLPVVTESPEPSPAATAKADPAPETTGYIGADAAAKAALDHAKADEDLAEVSRVRLTEDNGLTVYQVLFTQDGYSYEYLVEAVSGRIEGWSKSLTDEAAAAASVQDSTTPSPSPAATPTPSPSSTAQPTSSPTVLLSEEEAKKIVMEHANLTDKDVERSTCKLEMDGLQLKYEIDIYTTLQEYEYDVDAVTGQIVSFDIETRR